MIGYAKYFESNKTMSFKVIDKKLLKKYTKIWNKIKSLMIIEFDSEPTLESRKIGGVGIIGGVGHCNNY